MFNFEFLTVAQLEKHIDNNKETNSTLFTVEFNCKFIASYLKKQKSKIPPRHKSFNFFQKLTGIVRKTIQRWVLDKDLCFSTPYKRYFNGFLPSNTISNSQNSSRSRKFMFAFSAFTKLSTIISIFKWINSNGYEFSNIYRFFKSH